MEKLIELLNKEMEEKEKAWPKLARFTSYDGINKVFNLNNGCSFCVEFVLSKRYGFIKWLLDKDKINTNYITGYSIYWTDEYFTPYENLLMDLARFEEPLNYLASLLK